MLIISQTFREFCEGNSANVVCRLILRSQSHPETALVTTSVINYLTLRGDGMSYIPSNRTQVINENGTWGRQGREGGKPAKIVRKVIAPRFLRLLKERDFEEFANAYKLAYQSNGLTFALLPSSEIANTYADPTAQFSSCMNQGDSNNFAIYNAPNVQILTLRSATHLEGRALVWTLDDGRVFLDRFYTGQDHMKALFVEYAEDRGWLYKRYHNTYTSKTLWVCNGVDVNEEVRVTIPTDHDRYPYIDTFTFGGDGYLCNTESRTLYAYTSVYGSRIGNANLVTVTHGTMSGNQYFDCETTLVNGRRYHYNDINDETLVCINGVVYEIADYRVCQCRCLADGIFYLISDCEWSNTEDSYIPKPIAVYDEFEEDWLRA